MNESGQDGGHANDSLRFVQLSDLHLSSIGLTNPLRLLNKRILGYFSWLRRRRHTHQRWVVDLAMEEIKQLSVDHYTITGDLTHIGLKNEFEQAKQWLESIGQPEEITLIPGNHDLYINEKWSRSFKFWENYLHGSVNGSTGQDENSLNRLNQLFPIVHIRKHVAFIGLNSVFDAPWFRATGQLHPQNLMQLKRILTDPKLDRYCKILLIHHPITLANTVKRKRLLNHQDIISLLKQHPVNLVLHGHGHHSCTESITCNNDFITPIIGMSSTSSINQNPDYQAEFLLFQVTKKNQRWLIERQNYRLDIANQCFTTEQSQKQSITQSCASHAIG